MDNYVIQASKFAYVPVRVGSNFSNTFSLSRTRSYRQPLSLERSGYETNLGYQQVSMYISTLQTSVKIS